MKAWDLKSGHLKSRRFVDEINLSNTESKVIPFIDVVVH